MKEQRTLKQDHIANQLAEQFSIDAERIRFLNPDKPEEPWLPAEALVTIARQSGNFQAIDESFDQYIEPLQQVVHRATVIDREGRTYTRSGVARIGEIDELDDHALAAGRAVGAALTAAGFNPLRPGAVVSINPRQPEAHQAADEAQSRLQDLKRIHLLAERKGLIVPTPGGGYDRTKYRAALRQHYGTNSAAGFDAVQRASLINYLDRLADAEPEAVDEFAELVA